MNQKSIGLVIAGCHRDLPIVPVTDTTRIAFLDLLGDVELLDAAVRALLRKVPSDVDVILGGDTVGLVVIHHAAVVSGLPYVAARKKRTPGMRAPLCASAQSVAAATPSMFYLGEPAGSRLRGQHVLVMDEVCSTGATLAALRGIAEQAGANRITQAVICTEGQMRADVISLAHLPVWIDETCGL